MTWTRCHPTCHGVVINAETLGVERCDDCARFEDDDAAASWLAQHLPRMVVMMHRRSHRHRSYDSNASET